MSSNETHCRSRGDEIRRVTVVGMLLNVVLAGLKLVAGIVGNSQAVVADAVHSFSDLATDVAVLIGMRFWSAPADEEHPHGHGRIETMVAAIIGVALGAAGVGIGYQGIATIDEPHAEAPGMIALAAALLSIVSKEWLYRWTVGVGRKAKSQAVIANAWHHRSDALSSLPAAVAVGVAALWPALAIVDHIGAVLVAGFIVHAAWKITAPALGQLIDGGAPAPVRAEISSIALATPGVRLVHAVRTRYVGSGLHIDLHIQVDPEMSVREGHSISEEVKRRLIGDGPEVLDAIVHLEPYEPAEANESPPLGASGAREQP
ncbi:MAG: cation diffusion facilitator family transporter [Myxococcales bacterium]|jgi:cation diffusion facilitator family transporter